MNSNSDNPIYLCGRINKKTKAVEIVTIAIYRDHKLIKSIDLEYDKQGELIPYNPRGKGSHQHNWNMEETGGIGRKARQWRNHHPIDSEYMHLVYEIDTFNKERYKWKKRTESRDCNS